MRQGKEASFPQLKKPDDVDVTIELRDWLFALEGAEQMAERWWFSSLEDVDREERCWHTTFRSLRVNAKSSPKNVLDGKAQLRRIKQNPVELVTVKRSFFLIFQDFMQFVCKFPLQTAAELRILFPLLRMKLCLLVDNRKYGENKIRTYFKK